MPYITSTGELRDSSPLSSNWLLSIILGIWNFLYLMIYTMISPGYNKRDERDRRSGRDGHGGPWGGGGGGGGGGGTGPRQRRPLGRLGGGAGGATSPTCPPMMGGG